MRVDILETQLFFRCFGDIVEFGKLNYFWRLLMALLILNGTVQRQGVWQNIQHSHL